MWPPVSPLLMRRIVPVVEVESSVRSAEGEVVPMPTLEENIPLRAVPAELIVTYFVERSGMSAAARPCTPFTTTLVRVVPLSWSILLESAMLLVMPPVEYWPLPMVPASA